ncbi:sensor histidine kinase [Spongiactinospora sp. TRM90649]|uniref:sensor histidine kinase n=1 Tax=Spongiactinospora sp. TRM90649 TaxID=3031114 RepID=UPI0023F8BE41|nr:sensor histidine kinase [Spongiactinospora sp. TRM90649]MDF5757741.1 sensor histidine kinase [Spongiactinospora sp. TRM90649]
MRIPANLLKKRQTLFTIVLVVGVLGGTATFMVIKAGVPVSAWDYLVPAVVAAALTQRRRFPLAVLVVTALGCGFYYPYSSVDGPMILAVFGALYTAADKGHVLMAVVVAVAGLLAMGLGEVAGNQRHVNDSLLALLGGWMAACVAMGGVSHNRRAYLGEAERRVAEAERTREEEARRRAVEERLRIARDLHDVLGHNLSLINVQAGAALHRIADRPQDAAPALSAIKETSRETLRELRATLGVLRQADGEPRPGLAGLPDLVGRSGLDVRTEVTGDDLGDLPANVDLAAMRIVQEALTNVSRHSGVTTATVRIGRADGELRIVVEDEGSGAPAVPGYGITGMRERATALGGTLDAGPAPDGGFRVSARIPISS